jgi:aminobenzoyl-glutamate utilization protein B
MPDAKTTYDKLLKIAEGAALMTGTTWDVKYAASAWPQLVTKTIAEAIQRNIEMVGVPQWTDQEQQFARDFQKSAERPVVGLRTAPEAFGERRQSTSSNDNGDVSWVVPAGLLNFPASVPGIEYHEWHAAITPVSSISHKGQVVGAKVLAASIIDLLTSPELLEKARAEFLVESRKTPYFSLLPAEANPPLDLNRAEMEKYRPEMRKFYLDKAPRFN